MFTTAPIDFDDIPDDVVLITRYGGLFGQSLCDVKQEFKPSFVAKRHRIFWGSFVCLSRHNNLFYRKTVSAGISFTLNFILTSLVKNSH